MKGTEQLVLNRIICLECAEVLTSYYTHDYKTCNCANQTMIDGGLDYQRYGGVDLHKIDFSPTVYFSADPKDHGLMRVSFHWGTYGKDGDQERRWITPAQMSNKHIENILDNLGDRLLPWIKNILTNEQKHRSENNILIQD